MSSLKESNRDGQNIEIINKRTFAVDRQTLYGCFADPATLARWWGPHGFTNRITAFDLVPGGHWLITMTASNGTDFHNRWRFEDVVEQRFIRAVHHEPVHVFTLEMTFADDADGARLTWRMRFEKTEENEAIRHLLRAANEQYLDRLGAILK
nr:SRPBCC domain-containing protein [Marinicella sp. W31]MDC2876243.1 SRPBCC domain-containing protein [Marinicella sp. W31]